MEPVSETRATLGEGPIWWEGCLYWVDIEERRVYSYDEARDQERSIQLEQRVGTVVPRAGGGLMVALERGFAALDPESGRLEFLADPEADRPDNRFNDGKCDPAGRFWAGTLNMRGQRRQGALYVLETDGTVKKRLGAVSTSNGLCWSADARTMYYIDTPTKQVVAFDYDLRTGAIRNGRSVVTVAPGEGGPDGMTIDAEGNLWVAQWGGWGVRCYDPESGEVLEYVRVPASQTTAPAFGGPELRDLYVTTARVNLAPEELAKQPEAGALFRARNVGQGVEAFAYGG